MVSNAVNKSLNIAFSKTKLDLTENGILFLVNTFGADIYKQKGGATIGNPLGVSIGLLSEPNPRQGASILFVKNNDGSFTFYAAGTNTTSGTIPKNEIEEIFGNDDPSVYITLNDNWWGHGAAEGNYCIVKELSTGNTNGFTSYSDTWGRDIYATQDGVLEGITFKHFGNHGAHSNLAKKVPLNGLTLRGVSVDFMAMFRFGTKFGTEPENGFDGEGIAVRLDKNGSVYATCTYSIEPDHKIGTFDPYEKATIQIVKQKDGSYKVFVTGDETGKTFVYPVSKDFIEYMYGTDENPMVNIGYSAYNEGETSSLKTTTIEKIYNETDFDAVAPDRVEAKLAGKVITASIGEKHFEMEYSYQWYSNTTESNEGGTAISGATGETYTIPDGLKAGNYYYYCVITAVSKSGDTKSVATNVVKFTVENDEPKPDNTKPVNDNPSNSPKTGDQGFSLVLLLVALTCAGLMVFIRKKGIQGIR